MPPRMSPKAQDAARATAVVDTAGTDPGAADEIEDAARRKRALGGLEPTAPKFGNPFKQIGGFLKKVRDYDPYKKKSK